MVGALFNYLPEYDYCTLTWSYLKSLKTAYSSET